MNSNPPYGDVRPVALWQAALIGAIVVALLCLVFWATAAANVLPAGAPEAIRTFTPAASVSRLVMGLLLTGAVGAVLSALLALAYNLTRRRAH
jgi:hypothetical protein